MAPQARAGGWLGSCCRDRRRPTGPQGPTAGAAAHTHGATIMSTTYDKKADLAGPGVSTYEEVAKILPSDYRPSSM